MGTLFMLARAAMKEWSLNLLGVTVLNMFALALLCENLVDGVEHAAHGWDV